MTTRFEKNIYIRLCLVCLFVFVLFSSKVFADPNELVVGLDNSIERLIPIKIKTPQTMPVSMQIFQGLFDLNGEGKIVPSIIEKYETNDNKTWIFHVRKGVFFHKSEIFPDGTREVTAEDVIYSLQRFCSADSFASFLMADSVEGAAEFTQGKADSVKGFKYIDRHTLQIELKRAEQFFINRISTAWVAVFPKEMDDKQYADKSGFSIVVGTGPYKLVTQTENEIILEKNDDYWDEANQPQINKIIYKVIKNDQARYINLLRGKIDFMVVPSSLFSHVFTKDGELKKKISNQYQKKVVSTYNTHFIGINNKKILDANLRLAMFYGTDREEMVNTILYGFGDAMGGTVPKGMNGYKPLVDGNVYDPEKAAKFLSKSAYKGEALELIVHDLANSELIGQIFQAQMAMIDIKIKLTKLDFGGAVQRILSGDNTMFSMFMEYVYSSPEPILINSFASSKIPVPNFVSYSNIKVDEMLENLFHIEKSEASIIECARIEKRIMDDAPAVFLYRQKYVVLYPKRMNGLEINANNHYFFEKIKLK